MYRNIVIFLTIVLLSGCATPKEKARLAFIQSMDKWIGHTADELITTQGAPTNIYFLQSGGRELEYLRVLNLSDTPADEQYNPETVSHQSQQVPDSVLELQKRQHAHHPEQHLYVPDTRPPADNPTGVRKYVLGSGKTCKLLFEVTAGNIIESWSIDEGTCY